MILDSLLDNPLTFDFSGALITGIAEEAAKVLVVGFCIYKLNTQRIFNGLLIGAAIGAGFAAFENIMYFVENNTGQIESIGFVLSRISASIATHTEWCAITAAALVLAKGVNRRLSISDFANLTFLKFFISVALIHMLWDWNIYYGGIKYVFLSILTWTFVFVMIYAGMREFEQLKLASDDGAAVLE